MRLVLILYGIAICVGLCSHIKTVIGRVTYEIGVDAIRNSHLRRPLLTHKNSDW